MKSMNGCSLARLLSCDERAAYELHPICVYQHRFNKPRPQTPPLMGLVNINISHYRTATGGRIHGTPPQPSLLATTKKRQDFLHRLVNLLLLFQNENANAKYLEFEGKGLDSLKSFAPRKRRKPAALGVLTPSARRNEAADTAELRHMGENSILSAIAQTVSDGLNMALSIVAMWTNTQPVATSMNCDFTTSMTLQMITALTIMVVHGISGRRCSINPGTGEAIELGQTIRRRTGGTFRQKLPPMAV